MPFTAKLLRRVYRPAGCRCKIGIAVRCQLPPLLAGIPAAGVVRGAAAAARSPQSGVQLATRVRRHKGQRSSAGAGCAACHSCSSAPPCCRAACLASARSRPAVCRQSCPSCWQSTSHSTGCPSTLVHSCLVPMPGLPLQHPWQLLSHLSSYLEHVEGCVGPHQLLPHGEQQGNPVHSSIIRQLRKAYSNQMRSKGVSQGAATPVCFDQVQQLSQAMETALHESEPHTAAVAVMAARDGFLIGTLWHTALCGDNAGRLRASDIIFRRRFLSCRFLGQRLRNPAWQSAVLSAR